MANDVTILQGFVLFFVLLGILLPFFNQTFNTDYEAGFSDGTEDSQANTVSAWRIITSVLTGFIWSSEFPVMLNIIFIPFRIALFFLIARNIWIGGGG